MVRGCAVTSSQSMNRPSSPLFLSPLWILACSLFRSTTRLLSSLFLGFPSMWCTCSFGFSGRPKWRIMISLCSAIYPYCTSNTHLYGDDCRPLRRRPSDIRNLRSSVIGDFSQRLNDASDIFRLCSSVLFFLAYSRKNSLRSRLSIPNLTMRFLTVFRETPRSSAIC